MGAISGIDVALWDLLGKAVQTFQFASFWARWQTGCRDMQVLDFMQRERAWKICKKKSKDIWIEDLPLLK